MAIDRNETFDVIVVGAGPAGSAAALRLAEQRVKVLLIERGTAPGAKNMMGGVSIHILWNVLFRTLETVRRWNER